jgi:GTP-binding protein
MLGTNSFRIADMAGLETDFSRTDAITAAVQQQVGITLERADLVVLVVDGSMGITPADTRIAELLRRLKKQVLVVVNKLDHDLHHDRMYEFAEFGFETLVPLSALHNRGLSELKQEIAARLPEVTAHPEPERVDELRVSLVGRPNVGKSTLLNALLGEKRSVVSPIAGTTRDAVDTLVDATRLLGRTSAYSAVRLIDTAGIRAPKQMGHGIEAWSVVRTLDRIDAADVVLLLIDAAEGPTHQDMVVAEKIVDAGRPLIILANKWDAVLAKQQAELGSDADAEIRDEFQSTLLRKARFLMWSQLLFISAEEGINLQYIGKALLRAVTAANFMATPDQLKELLKQLQTFPRLKNLLGFTQTKTNPPTFIATVEGRELPHFTTRRSIDNRIREAFAMGPTPIKLWIETTLDKYKPKRR